MRTLPLYTVVDEQTRALGADQWFTQGEGLAYSLPLTLPWLNFFFLIKYLNGRNNYLVLKK